MQIQRTPFFIELPTTNTNEKIQLTYSQKTHSVVAHLIIKDLGQTIAIKPENIPREFRKITSAIEFQAFLKNTYAQAPRMSNGDVSLHIQRRLLGGGGGEDAPKSSVYSVEDPDLIDKIMEIVNQGLKELLQKQIKQKAILLVGRTGAGKSMLGNLLSGSVEIKGVATDDFEFKFEAVNPIFPVGDSNIEAGTTTPNIYSPSQKDHTFIDTPGFDDPGLPERDIANLFFRKEVLRNVKSMKFLLVVDWTDFKKRGTYFPSTFNDLIQFLGMNDVQDERLKNLAESIILIISHTPPHENSKVRKKVKEDLEEYQKSTSLSTTAKSLLREILKNERWDVFSSPSGQGICPKVGEERIRILKLLNEPNSRYISKSKTDLQAKVNKKYEGMIQTSLASLVETLKKGFAGRVLNEVTAYLKKFYLQVSGEKAIQKFQKKFHALITSQDAVTLSELLREFQFSAGIFDSKLIEEAKRHDASIKFLVDLLPTKQAALFSHRRNWIKELNLEAPLLKWNTYLVNLTSPAVLECQNGKMTLQGYFPKTSQITTEIHKYKDIKQIEIHASHTVTIDEDLSGPELQGVNVTIIAPKWEIRSQRKIDLSGKDCTHTYTNRATDGANPGESGSSGSPGLPGDNAGHFIGIGYVFSGIDRLTVIANGGKGGPGQNGGVGQAGEDGADGAAKLDFTKTKEGAHDKGTALSMGWDYVEFPPNKTGKRTYDQTLRMDGKTGQRGGHGGMGGAGGNGGLAGSVIFVPLSDSKLSVKSVTNGGDEGIPGASGAAGIGGRNGRHWQGVWHTGDNPDNGWNGHAQYQPQYHPSEKTSCQRVASGTEPTAKNDANRQPAVALKPVSVLAHLYNYRQFAIVGSSPLTLNAIEAFRKIYDKNDFLKGKESIENFIEECDHMEDLFTSIEDKSKCLPLYQWMSERLQAFSTLSNATDAALLQCLYTSTLSKILQINATRESRLIIDIKGFLDRIGKNIKILKEHDHGVKVLFYEHEYEAHLDSKIQEADAFLLKLSEDIKASNKEIDAQIKKLGKEIDGIKATNQASAADMAKKKEELREQIKKKKMFGYLAIAAQCIGCFFPPAGPIVGGIVSAGLTMMSNPRAGTVAAAQVLSVYTDGISGAIQGNKGALSNAQHAALTRVRDIALTTAALDVVDLPGKSEEEQIKALDKLIDQIHQQQGKLDDFKEKIHSSLAPSLHDFVDGASKAQAALQGQSKIALDFSRLGVKRVFENVKRQLKEATKSFASGEGFLTIIRQMEEAIETSANIYDHIQEYEERRVLVKYMANLASTQVQDPRIEVYKQKVQRNLILEQYSRALSAVRQWSFPFASLYLADCAVLKQFLDSKSMDSFMNLVTQQLKLLQDKVSGSYTQVNSTIDTFLWQGKFSTKAANGPFYVWNCKENQKEIMRLLRGEQVVLFADINRTSLDVSAVKFNHIELQIRSTDPLINEDLAEDLKGLRIELRHSGLSYYKHEGKTYQMSNDQGFSIRYRLAKEGEEPDDTNEVYNKMKDGNFMLSPYTSWAIELEKDIFKKYAKDLHTIEVCLVGQGQYIKVDKAKGKIKQMDQYDENITFEQTSVPPSSSIPKPQTQSAGEQNAHAQKDNSDYLYQATDVKFIVHSPTISKELKNFHFIQGMQAEHLSKKADEIFELLKKGKAILCVYNISNIHWVAFALLKQPDGQLITLYKNSYGAEDNEVFDLLKTKTKVLSHPASEQAGDTTSCGIFSLENIRIMARELNADRDRFIRQFDSQAFCTLQRAKDLRQGDFARFYTEGKQELENEEADQAKKSEELTKKHQKEVDEIVICLQKGLTQQGITVQSTALKKDATRTIVIQIGAEDANFTNYHYRIEASKDISEKELQDILSGSEYAWYNGDDYRIEDGVIKVFKKTSQSKQKKK